MRPDGGTVETMNALAALAVVENTAPLTKQIELTVLVVWAMFLGGLVGVERERASKASGIRTHMLVAGAAAIVVYISEQIATISGLTTAAAIFHTAAIGTAVAAGYGIAATFGTVMAIVVLYGIGHFSHKHPLRPERRPGGPDAGSASGNG